MYTYVTLACVTKDLVNRETEMYMYTTNTSNSFQLFCMKKDFKRETTQVTVWYH